MSINIKGRTVYGPNIVTDGLVLYLDAANTKSYPGSGAVWYDLSGFGNSCIFDATPTYNATHLIFNGTSHYGTIVNNSTLDFSNEQTIIMWLYHTFTTGRRNPWNQAYGGYGTWTHESGNSINHYFGDAGANTTPYIAAPSNATPRGVWNCMTSTRDVSNHKWYMNGIWQRTTSHSYSTLLTDNNNITIGSGYAGYWEGNISIIMVYNRALSQSEISQNYNAQKSRYL